MASEVHDGGTEAAPAARLWRALQSRYVLGGGYALARSPEAITILAVINAVAPLERIRKCPLGISSHRSLCPLHAELDRAYAATEAAFDRVTIAQLLETAPRRSPLCQTCE